MTLSASNRFSFLVSECVAYPLCNSDPIIEFDIVMTGSYLVSWCDGCLIEQNYIEFLAICWTDFTLFIYGQANRAKAAATTKNAPIE